MAEIKINIDSLKDAIDQLHTLRDECVNYGNLCPETVGGGLTVSELENLVKTYDQLDNHFIQLISNTILFMQNVQKSFESSDKKAANNIQKK